MRLLIVAIITNNLFTHHYRLLMINNTTMIVLLWDETNVASYLLVFGNPVPITVVVSCMQI